MELQQRVSKTVPDRNRENSDDNGCGSSNPPTLWMRPRRSCFSVEVGGLRSGIAAFPALDQMLCDHLSFARRDVAFNEGRQRLGRGVSRHGVVHDGISFPVAAFPPSFLLDGRRVGFPTL